MTHDELVRSGLHECADDCPRDPMVDALAYALARAKLPGPLESSRTYAARLAPLVRESGFLAPPKPETEP